MKSSRVWIIILFLLFAAVLFIPDGSNMPQPPVYTYKVVNIYPHDPDAFTQGLVYHDRLLYEGTGLRGQSSLRIVDLESGNILKMRNLPPEFFGEGITVLGDRIYQLTWQSRTGFIYDKDNFEIIRNFSYPGEGWGITHNKTYLIVSDGTSNLYYIDPVTLQTIRTVQVHDSQGPVTELNELEYVNGKIYANVWKTDLIAIIDPGSGQVIGWIDLEGLLDESEIRKPVDVLNGIAYDGDNDRLFVTGKLWPGLFQIEIISGGKEG